MSVYGITPESYNPTYEELVRSIVNRFSGLDEARARAIVEFMVKKNAIKEYPDGTMCRTMVLGRRLPVTL